jgi:hypothetical protein
MRSKRLQMGLATVMALGVMVGGGAAIANAASGKSSSNGSTNKSQSQSQSQNMPNKSGDCPNM